MEIHLVGGAVRDALLGRPVTDRDYLVLHATQEAFQARYPTARLVGKSFPVFILEGSEYAWPRGGCLENDLLLRDLTINAMAKDSRGEIHAHPLALNDIENKVLRPCSPSSMQDDPVRIFRAARFVAQFPDFSASDELLEQMRQVAQAGFLGDQAAERVGREVVKALGAPNPSRFLELLRMTGCLSPWFEEVAACVGAPAGPAPYHDNVFQHTLKVMDRLALSRKDVPDPLLVWMGLTHDLGKGAASYGHDKAGAVSARTLGMRLRLPAVFIEAGAMAASERRRVHRYAEMRPGSRVDLLMRLEAKRLTTRMFKLAAADIGANLLPLARRDLRVIRAVTLPADKRDMGEASGEILRQLRCEAVAALMRRPDDETS